MIQPQSPSVQPQIFDGWGMLWGIHQFLGFLGAALVASISSCRPTNTYELGLCHDIIYIYRQLQIYTAIYIYIYSDIYIYINTYMYIVVYTI